MNNPFGLPDELFSTILEAAAKSAMNSSGQNVRRMTTPNLPPKPSKELAKLSAESSKDMYDAYIAAGFTEVQAFDLLKTMLSTGMRK